MMSRFVDSVFSFLGRRASKDQAPGDKAVAKRSRGGRKKALLKADSFVFLPGECTSSGPCLWGEVITPRTVGVPVSSYSEDYSVLSGRGDNAARRKNVRSVLVDGSGKVVGRRLSGTFVSKSVKGRKSLDAVEDGSLEAFLKDFEAEGELDERCHTYDRADACESVNPEDERYIYDRLVHLPLRSPGPASPPGRRFPAEVGERETRRGSGSDRRTSKQVLDLRDSGRRRTSSGGSAEQYYAIPADQVAARGRRTSAVDWEGLREQLKMAAIRGDDYAEVREPDRQVLGRSIQSREVVLEERIGEGQFGDVHKGILYPGTKDEVPVAVKTCKSDAAHEDRVKFLEEAAVMKKFDHPHIIRLFGVVSHERKTYIVMELAPLGQLRRYLLTEGSRIPKLLLLRFISQLSAAMVHLEAKSYVHRDIAARNVLVTSPNVVKLADFGLSRGLQDGDYYVASRGKLPIKWMAPESINFRRFTGLSDVWMFGVCCWEILMRGVKPFVGIKNDEVISKIELGERLPLPAECPAPLFGLMNRCWSYDPDKRPDFRLVEASVAEILEEEKQLSVITSRRLAPDSVAPQKPPYRPHSSQGLMQVNRHSGASDDDSAHHRMSGHIDDTLLGPALPPRISTRFREHSASPHPPLDNAQSSPYSSGSETPPPKPPRRVPSPSNHGDGEQRSREGSEERWELPRSHGNHSGQTHAPIIPYSVTTITPMDSNQSPPHQVANDLRRSESPRHPVAMATIPPPAIISQRGSGVSQPGPSSGVYYSIPEDGGRSLGIDGRFGGSGGVRGSMVASESSHEAEGEEGGGAEEQGDEVQQNEVLGKVTDVVKAVMELSNRVSHSSPDQFVDLVKGVGMAMRELLHSVDTVRQRLPQQMHQEMDMAQKVLSSDFNNLIKAMKEAQKHYNTFLEGEYQKEMLKAAHVVAKNSKLLFDAVGSSTRRAQQIHR